LIAPPPAIEREALQSLVRRAWFRPFAEITTWQSECISSGSATCGGVYRVAGSAEDLDGPLAWSLIVKVLHPLTDEFLANCVARAGSGNDLTTLRDAWRWDREALAYRSGLLDDLPAPIRAPRCYTVEERPDGTIALWLEDVAPGAETAWTIEHFGRAARLLGRFQAAYLVDRPLPSLTWLSRAWVRAFVSWMAVQGAQVVLDPHKWEHPLVRRTFAASVVGRFDRLWAERETLLTGLERLPQTLCHHDVHQDNATMRRDPSGGDQLALFDWSFAGPDALGSDLGQLVGYALITYGVDAAQVAALDQAVFENYLSGLRDGGWRGDARLPRLGYAAATALRHAMVVPQVNLLSDELRLQRAAQRRNCSIQEIAAYHATITDHVLALADEARALLQALQ
jgi:hypothetical protein